jgi:hypothetical protein
MLVTFNGTSSVTLTKPNGAEVTIPGVNIQSVNATQYENYAEPFLPTTTSQTSVPQTYDPTTGVWTGGIATSSDQWLVYVHLLDGTYEKLVMGRQTGAGAGWTNTLVGANAAVAAFEAIMV